MIMQKAKLTVKRQITVPIRVVRRLGLNPGDMVIFEEVKNHIEIQSAKKKFSAIDIIGKYPELSTKKITDQDIQKIRKKIFVEKSKEFSY
ncbi:hypothetical protein MNBD_UNCLBAC01-1935 [hydrothermal vent metagenome]|uniref:SpoVT-AbrB domain-containing protein n=1 Tax=hydrothermal vent metagenome TaxID=652676 RepID=A0A3B1DNA2_9ZZZZ